MEQDNPHFRKDRHCFKGSVLNLEGYQSSIQATYLQMRAGWGARFRVVCGS